MKSVRNAKNTRIRYSQFSYINLYSFSTTAEDTSHDKFKDSYNVLLNKRHPYEGNAILQSYINIICGHKNSIQNVTRNKLQ